MLNSNQEEQLVQLLIDRINALNEDILEIIGNRIKEIGEMTPTQVHQINQMLMYNTDIDRIIQKLAEVSGMNVNDIYSLFEYSAKTNQDFARQFYRARGISYIPYAQNKVLKDQVRAIAEITAREYANISRTSAIGYTIKDLDGNITFKDISSVYKDTIDKAILNVSQGKTTYRQEMRKAIKQIGQSGLKTIDYESGRSVRLDSAIRQNTLEGLRTLTNEIQQQFGEEFGADGVEVSHHINSAPDHIDTVDGKQFSLNGDKVVNGKLYKDFNTVNNSLDRQVSTLNCRHYIFSIVLGVNKPQYTDKQLEEDKKKNKQGFDFEGKHYSNYEGEQLQRLIEREIRKQKDIQILAKASGDKELTQQVQAKITQLTIKYRQVVKVSGLPNQLKTRASVVGYKRINVANM